MIVTIKETVNQEFGPLIQLSQWLADPSCKCAVRSIHPISKISSLITRTLETIIENDLKHVDKNKNNDEKN